MFALFRFAFIGITLCALVPVAAAEKAGSASSRPNVIIIVADDQGYHDLGVQGAKDIKTPNVDALAAGGVRFTQGYVTCPVCSPSRAGLLTGRYQEHFGHEFNPGPQAAADFGLPTDQKMLSNYMKEAGYVTAAVGKWHLGQREECRPLQRGFDEYFGFLGGAHSYVPVQSGKGAKNGIFRNNEEVDAPPYLTYAFNKEAISFIERHKQQPFFLYLAYNAIHTPQQQPPDKEGEYPEIKDPKRHAMATMLDALDEGVGAIRQTLKKDGLEDNTFIFYMSDNGGPTYGNGSRNDPLRGFKGETLEGGIRIPMMMRWPGHVPVGKVYEKPVISLDALPTILEVAGISKPAEASKDAWSTATTRLDGVSLLPFVTGKNGGTPHRDLFWRFGNQFAVRSGDYKLVQTRGEAPKLYNLAQDIGEKKDLTASEGAKAKELQGIYDKWNSLNIAPKWHDSRQAHKELQARASDDGTTGGKVRMRRAGRPAEKVSGKGAARRAAKMKAINAEDDE